MTAAPEIQASAPGKLVLAGEYAVLAGAPAVVAAIDRRVTCRLGPRDTGGWVFRSRGFEARTTHARDALPTSPGDPGTLVRHVLDRLRIDPRTLPEHLDIGIDSRPCFHAGVKLGLGSSAAATVATAAAVAELAGAEYALDPLFDIHRDLQGGSGSGLDVAACHRGGVIRFQSGAATALRLPPELHYLFVHVGWGTETADLVGRFNAWRGSGHPPELRRLMELAEAVAEAGDAFLERLAPYIDALEALDRAADLGIVSAPHRQAGILARGLGLLYKPCGAGGGDMGIAFARDAQAISSFRRAVEQIGLLVVPGAIARSGVRLEHDAPQPD